MGYSGGQAIWRLVESQHGVVARAQLLALGFSARAIHHRVAKGRLHSVGRGVYAVGRPGLTQHGRWMAAVLTCGPEAVLSHGSAALLWGIWRARRGPIEVSVPGSSRPRRVGLIIHRRAELDRDVTRHELIPVTTPVCTLVDIALRLTRDELENAVNEADKRDLVDPEVLRSTLAGVRRRPGVNALRKTLDRRMLRLTDSQLERLFLPIAQRAGLPCPLTQQYVNGHRVDFYWPDLALIVEVDGLRYHRTPAQQAKDRVRDQAHAVGGLTQLRFTHAQVRYEPETVRETLVRLRNRLSRTPDPWQTPPRP